MHLWEMDTHWFTRPDSEAIHTTFPYKSWKDFQDCKPYKLWKPYILSSWSWKTRSIEEYKQPKKRETDGYAMDCQNILRLKPSSYDKPPLPLDISQNSQEVDMLQIVFLSPDRYKGVHRVEVVVSRDNEEDIRNWLKRHMPKFWILDEFTF
jgi:hypothetical protein